MTGARLSRPRGTADLLPGDAAAWQELEALARELFRRFGYGEIRTPLFEATDLFLRVGEETDVVAKEMYTFTDKAGRSLTLRPEGTAGAVRAYLEAGLESQTQPTKLYYISAPMFRYDRPEAGRYRQFHQMGVELIGASLPAADAEVVTVAHTLLAESGLAAEVHLNSVGCPVCRPVYRDRLRAYYAPHREELCPDCQRRYAVSPLRLLDCKQPTCQVLAREAPAITDALCDACAAHLAGVEELLTAGGVPFRRDPGVVRGLDYYRRTVFEVVHPDLGALCGGGRYDGLVEDLGGPPVPAVGFALGVERWIAARRQAGLAQAAAPGPDLYLVRAGEDPALEAEVVRLAIRLRRMGLGVETDLMGRSLKAQMRHAHRLGARHTAVLGPQEAARGTLLLRDMATGAQEELPWEELVRRLAPAGTAAPPADPQAGAAAVARHP